MRIHSQTVVKGSTANLKIANRQSIISLLLQQEPLSKQDIARITSLSFSSVSNLITEMIGENLILESGMAESAGGRRAALYKLNPRAYVVVGADIQLERLCLVIVGANGVVIASEEEPLDLAQTPQQVVEWVADRIRTLIAKHDLLMENVAGVGVSAPGPMDLTGRMVLSPPNMIGWRNVPLVDMFEQSLGVPCLLEKDANAAAFGEFRYGSGKGIDNLLYILADAGIGGALVMNGELYRGAFNDAGDIGHVAIDMNGPRCQCGGIGCLEAMGSGLAMEREASKVLGRAVKIAELSTLCEGNQDVRDVVERCLEYLGYGIGGLCNALNPGVVILGGRLMVEDDMFYQTALESVRRQILPDFVHQVRIVRPSLGAYSGAIGVALLVILQKYAMESINS